MNACGYCRKDLVKIGPAGMSHYACPTIAATGHLCQEGMRVWSRGVSLQEPSKTEKSIWDPPI